MIPDPSTGGTQIVPPVGVSYRAPRKKGRNIGDVLFKNSTLLFAGIVFSLVFLMTWEMYSGSRLSIEKFGWNFLASSTWDPVQDQYGSLPFIFGTVVTSLVGLAIALPLSLGVAIFLSEIAPRWLAQPFSFLVELLAAIPSIVYGMWGVFVLVPWMRLHGQPFLSKTLGFLPLFKGVPYGFGMLTASVILAIMILPIITAITRDVLQSIPNLQREAALAIGANGLMAAPASNTWFEQWYQAKYGRSSPREEARRKADKAALPAQPAAKVARPANDWFEQWYRAKYGQSSPRELARQKAAQKP